MEKNVSEKDKKIFIRRHKFALKMSEHISKLCKANLALDTNSLSLEEMQDLLNLAVTDLARFNEYIIRYDSIEIR